MSIFAADRLELESVNTLFGDHYDVYRAFQEMWVGAKHLTDPAFNPVPFDRIAHLLADGDSNTAVRSCSRLDVVNEPLAPETISTPLREHEVPTFEEPGSLGELERRHVITSKRYPLLLGDGHGEAFTTSTTTLGDGLSTSGGRHTGPKSMLVESLSVAWLVGPLHGVLLGCASGTLG